MIWLASFPRSGNTFLRIILHEVYGISSSTFHQETSYPVDPNYDQYPVVKTHLLPSQLVPHDPGIPAVYLVRDGRDALVSIAHHRSDLIAPGTDFYENLRTAILATKGSFFGGWSQNVSEWLSRASLVIRFEDLIADPITSAERLRPFLDLPPPNLEKVPTFQDLQTKPFPYGPGAKRSLSPDTIKQRRLKFFRRGRVGAWRDEMPEDLHDLFWELHGHAMKKLDYVQGKSSAGRIWRLAKRKLKGNKMLSFLKSTGIL